MAKQDMEVFEIHITGDEGIHKAAKEFGIKTITVNLLTPNRELLRVEHMTSHLLKLKSISECMEYVKVMKQFIESRNVALFRTKIESPCYSHYVNSSCYIECHFKSEDFILPTSQNAKKTDFLATDREYDKKKYSQFVLKNKNIDQIELCLFDSYVEEDKDWFDLYKTGDKNESLAKAKK